MKKIVSLFGLLAVAVFVTSCTAASGNVVADVPADPDDMMDETDTMDDSIATGDVVEIHMESFTEVIDGQYFPQFSEKEIRVKKGDTVRLYIETTSGAHNFKIDELDVYSETPTGEVTVIEFVADEAGEFVYYCTKPRHRENGHWGTLIVE